MLKAAILVASLAALGRVASWLAPAEVPARSPRARGSGTASAAFPSLCPPGTLPDGNACVPVPEPAAALEPLLARVPAGSLVARRPERPASFTRYLWPVPISEGAVQPASDEPATNEAPDASVRDAAAPVVRPGALHLTAQLGSPVTAIRLEHQQREAEVLFTGTLFGRSVVALHQAGERQRHYLVAYGHLDALAPGVRERAPLRGGAALGAAGPLPEGGAGLHLEIRQLLDGVDPHAYEAAELMHPARSVAVDARNVVMLAR